MNNRINPSRIRPRRTSSRLGKMTARNRPSRSRSKTVAPLLRPLYPAYVDGFCEE